MLKICYLSDIPSRIRNCRRILEMMDPDKVLYSNFRLFRTENAEYRFVNCRDPNSYMGIYADQAVIDYREPMIEIAKIITARSCVPEEYKIIDDRSIGAYG